jgi:hypothetical protein
MMKMTTDIKMFLAAAALVFAIMATGAVALAETAAEPGQCVSPTERPRGEIIPGDRSAPIVQPKMEFCTEFPEKCRPWTGMTTPSKPKEQQLKNSPLVSELDKVEPESKEEKPSDSKKDEKKDAKKEDKSQAKKDEVAAPKPFKQDPEITNFCFLNPHYCRPVEPPTGYVPNEKTSPLIDHILNICKRDNEQCLWLPEEKKEEKPKEETKK